MTTEENLDDLLEVDAWRFSEDGYQDLKQALLALIKEEITKARIDELNHVISKVNGVGVFSWYDGKFVSRAKRIAQLQAELKEER